MQPTSLREVTVALAGIVLANALFVGAIAADVLPRALYNYGRFLLLGAVLIAVVWRFRGGDGVAGLFRPMTNWRRAPGWYLLAVAWAPGLAALTLILAGLAWGGGLSLAALDLGTIARPGVIATLIVGSFIGEIVWVSYAIAALSRRISPLAAGLVVGVVWTLWWLPMVWFNIGVIPDLPVPTLFLHQMSIAAMCAFVYMRTRSGLIVFVMQMVVNGSVLVFPVAPSSGGLEVYSVLAAVYAGATLAVYLLAGRDLMRGPQPAMPVAARSMR